jgi:hypothetical protein
VAARTTGGLRRKEKIVTVQALRGLLYA